MNMQDTLSYFLVVALCIALAATPATAHTDPGGCNSNGVGLSGTVFRADGTTPVGGGTVESGETIKYQVTLSHLGGSNCNFEDGTLTITTPDGVGHVVASGAGIPLVESGSPFVAPQQSYVVSEADVSGGSLEADFDYANGVSHLPSHGTAQAGNNIFVPFEDIALRVTKTAVPTIDESFTWTIDKTANETSLLLADGQVYEVEYNVTVEATSSGAVYAVSGVISVYNPAQFANAVITDVFDDIEGFGAAVVDCGVVFPYDLAPDTTLECDYSATLPNDTTRENNATATTSGDVDGDSGQATIDFAEATPSIIDDCVDVSDTLYGDLGQVCEDASPHTFEYTLFIGADPEADYEVDCGETNVPNVASYVTDDTETTDDDNWNILVNVDCDEGCTLTQGYWKTHNDAFHGGAPTDDNWENVGPLAEEEVFFPATVAPPNTDTWFAVFWTAPKGNAYYNLAHQYMAAVLNELNGADVPTEVSDAMDVAEDFFEDYTPSEAANMLKGKNKKDNKPLHQDVISAAGTLGSYNEGAIGPGHCDEDGNSQLA